MKDQVGARFVVKGKVQGVWFRASTQEQAQEWQITGWTRNLPDGSVEVAAYGSQEQIDKLREWLHEGPPLAKVSEVLHEAIDWQMYSGFDIVR